MKRLVLTIFLSLIVSATFSQRGLYADGFEEWEVESRTNNRLLPKYGGEERTVNESSSDSIFVEATMSQGQFGNRHTASEHMIKLGWDYFYRDDLRTAMYRFNQAYLLDSLNTNIYWGFGAIYMRFGYLGLASAQYEEGLALDSTNTNLLTDYATMFLAQYYRLEIESSLDKALMYFNLSYAIDPKDVNTTYKLSITHWLRGDCTLAKRYLQKSKKLGGDPITEQFKSDLKKKCG